MIRKEIEINFAQGAAKGGNRIGRDLPHTYHPAIEGDDDGIDKDDNSGGRDDKNLEEGNANTPKDEEIN